MITDSICRILGVVVMFKFKRVQCLFLVVVFVSSGSLFAAFGQNKQLSLADILIALRSKKAEMVEKNRILTDAVKSRGITFTLTPEIEKELGSTGADPQLLTAIRDKAPVIKETTNVTLKETVEVKPEPLQIASLTPKVSLAPPNFDFYWNRAKVLLEKGDTEAALPELDRAIELRPGDARSRLERGNVLVKQGKFAASIEDFDSSIQVEPNSVAFYSRAVANEKLEKIDEAIADYQKAYDLDAKNDAAKVAFARLTEEKALAKAKLVTEPTKVEPTAPVSAGPIQIGPLNNFASRLMPPNYTELDRRMGFQGKVTVLISLDEEGKVISAEANSGPKNLRASAIDAIRKSKFEPVLVEGKAVKAAGYIIFNFIAKK